MDLALLFERMEEGFRAGLPADPEPVAHYSKLEEDMEIELRWWELDAGLQAAIDKYEIEGIYTREV